MKNKQTGSKRGTFLTGSPHPTLSGVVFCHYYKRRSGSWAECWLTVDQLRSRNDKNNERSRKRNVEFREQRLATQAKYRQNNIEKLRASGRKYQSEHRDKYAMHTASRRSRVKKASTGLSGQDKMLMACFYSMASRLSSCTGIQWDVDHVVPISRGGLHAPFNLQVVPHRWNQVKNNKNNKKIGKL